jgi:5-(carboxyamino)imidazole ribonucleotide mutase
LFAVAMLAQNDAALQAKLEQFRKDQTAAAQGMTLPTVGAA